MRMFLLSIKENNYVLNDHLKPLIFNVISDQALTHAVLHRKHLPVILSDTGRSQLETETPRKGEHGDLVRLRSLYNIGQISNTLAAKSERQPIQVKAWV